ncbi:MAG: serine/threonine protein kinase [Bryobacterales bacterium]|nr:serine/threonine protein kinase [Bryobacterales bacterium]
MNADSLFTRAETIFLETVAIAPGPERHRFLEHACQGDAALLAWVEDLLRHDGDLADEFDFAIQSVAAAMASDVLPRDEDWLGRIVGGYWIQGKLGSGGMGSVFLAERGGTQVAVKVVHPSMGAILFDRLRQEQRILARLTHPNIARLLDAGETREGVPFLVMEYVDGVPILPYCRQHACGPREACRLMIAVCEAVAYAHRCRVIHRDLKPANILVDRFGTPKLLDFGIAALLGVEPGHGGCTPKYASPELRQGQRGDASTDVYSLGILLRELLGADVDAGLGCILAKAIAPQPQARYATAEAVGRDLAAYLRDSR